MTQDRPVTSYAVTGAHEANASGVTWTAVLAGAVVTAALWLILLSLGAGLGLSSVSPWASVSSGKALAAGAIVWLIVAEILSSAMGGYLAGRLRTKWTTVHSDEVYFRDTAHGFLAWSTALVVTAAFLGAAAASMVGASTTKTETAADPNVYFVDQLFRAGAGNADNASFEVRSEAAVILARGLSKGALDAGDKAYLDQQVAAKTGSSAADADRRVTDTFAQAQDAAETARKVAAHTLLWLFIALLIGAFTASFAATIGGRQRDHVVTI